MANKSLSLEALKAHLFEVLEGVKNLSDEEADPCEKVTIEQAKTCVDVADSIIDIYKTQVEAFKTFTHMDNVASPDRLMVGVGFITPEEQKMLEG